jgi:hypothetical protein
MSDNTTLNAMSGGDVIAADDISGVKYQWVKLVDGTADGTAKIAGDATYGLAVDPKRLPAGEIFLGFVGGKQKNVSANFTRPNDSTAYAAGDQVANSTSSPTVMTFSGVARANAGSGVIIAATLLDSAAQTTKGQFDLFLFDTTMTPANDNAAAAPTDTVMGTCIGVIQFNAPIVGDPTSGATGNCIFQANNLSIPFTTGASSQDIFGMIVVRNAYTPVAQEIFTVRLTVIQN